VTGNPAWIAFTERDGAALPRVPEAIVGLSQQGLALRRSSCKERRCANDVIPPMVGDVGIAKVASFLTGTDISCSESYLGLPGIEWLGMEKQVL
jgi:hypothetical protein